MSATSCRARRMAGRWRGVGGGLVIEHCDPPPMPHSGCRAMAQGSAFRSAAVSGSSSPAGIGAHQRPQRRDPVAADGQAELGAGVVQGQGEVVDAGPLGHETENRRRTPGSRRGRRRCHPRNRHAPTAAAPPPPGRPRRRRPARPAAAPGQPSAAPMPSAPTA